MKNFEGSREELVTEIRRRQRSLIPLNLLVVIIAVIAALSLMFTPIITVDLTNAEEVIGNLTGQTGDSDGNSDEEQPDYAVLISSLTKSIGPEVSLTTRDMMQLSFTDDTTAYIKEIAADALASSSDDIIIEVGLPAVMESLKENNPDLEIPEIEQPEEILNSIKGLETAQPEEVDSVINGVADEIQSQLGTDVIDAAAREQLISSIRDIYDSTVANTADGSFSVEACICVIASQYLNDTDSQPQTLSAENDSAVHAADFNHSGDGSATTDEENQVFTTYEELADYMVGSMLSSESSAEINAAIDNAVLILRIVTIAMMFFAALWIILALFAFVHTFTKNRRFTMWYVKLFGFIPCLIFGIVPLVAPVVLTALLPEVAATVVPVLEMLSTMTWISGACYIVLWLISIFWAFPIKRRIRRYTTQLKYAK